MDLVGMKEALKTAAEKAGITEYRIRELTKTKRSICRIAQEFFCQDAGKNDGICHGRHLWLLEKSCQEKPIPKGYIPECLIISKSIKAILKKLVLYFLSLVYGMVVNFRNTLFNLNILRAREFDVPVISSRQHNGRRYR